MPWQWINRIFNRASSVPPHYESTLNANHSEPSATIDTNKLNLDETENHLIQSTSNELESAFFCWLLNCTESELQMTTDQLNEKEQKILKTLDHDALSIDQIPRRPASFPLLIKLLNKDDSSTREISNTLLADPALATQTLKTANSPFFRVSSEPIDSVEQAVFILGSEGIRNIISATVMMPLMKGGNSKEGEFSQKVWEWGLLSATASDQYSFYQGHESSALYILGLLPALTYLLIYRSLLSYSADDPSIGELEPSMIKSIIQKRNWKMCHEICQQWGLPPASNKYLLDAERPSTDKSLSPLRDGIFMGTHKILQSVSRSPIADRDVHRLSRAPKAVDKKVIKYLEEKLKAASAIP
ncbi:HDOD domain-containing protein [Alkalimarinus alittae]|uniref:HDOD domain-containing protein n=1 Tax=Alkalimarinus alittae TaxID=2961619 RepID=A0ABY6MXK2_9ALTE|nr:HDOD domain-containing protein [Alkalimarinus alittae]UZE94554.1 HDOD domain-containing protein [Alkalimarinus alittae]